MDYEQIFADRLGEQEVETTIKEENQEDGSPSPNANVENPEEPWPHSKIRFDSEVMVVEVKARSLITTIEKRATWYQPSDFSRISSMNRISVKALRENPDNPDHCVRGLEHKLHGGSDRIRDIKVNSIFAVLKEQLHQRKSKTHDPMKIASVYKEYVFTSVRKAEENGTQDEKNARQVEQPKIERRRSSAVVFDDFDLKELQDLDLHDDMERFEARMSEVQQPTETYEIRKGKKKSNQESGRRIRRSLSPKPPKASTRSISPKPQNLSDQREKSETSLPGLLTGKLSRLIRQSRSPKRNTPSLQRWGSKRTELPLPGQKNESTSKLPKKGLRKINSDVF